MRSNAFSTVPLYCQYEIIQTYLDEATLHADLEIP